MRKFTFMLLMTLSISILGACELFGFDSNLERKIDPKPTMDTLNSEDLNDIIATESGYKKYRHELQLNREGSRNMGDDAFDSPPLRFFEDLIDINAESSSIAESISYTDTVRLIFTGVYNTENDTAYGRVVKTTDFGEKVEEEFPLLYENDQYINPTTDEAYHFTFLADKLKGLDEFIGPVHKYGLTDNKELLISFTSDDDLEAFSDFLNDELQIDYDQLDYASIAIGLTAKHEYIDYIDLLVRWTKQEGDGEAESISYTLKNRISFSHDGATYEEEYENFKKQATE